MSIGFIKFFVLGKQYRGWILCSVTNYIRIMMGMEAHQKTAALTTVFCSLNG